MMLFTRMWKQFAADKECIKFENNWNLVRFANCGKPEPSSAGIVALPHRCTSNLLRSAILIHASQNYRRLFENFQTIEAINFSFKRFFVCSRKKYSQLCRLNLNAIKWPFSLQFLRAKITIKW